MISLDFSAFAYAIRDDRFYIQCRDCGQRHGAIIESEGDDIIDTFDEITNLIAGHVTECINARAWQIPDTPNELTDSDEL